MNISDNLIILQVLIIYTLTYCWIKQNQYHYTHICRQFQITNFSQLILWRILPGKWVDPNYWWVFWISCVMWASYTFKLFKPEFTILICICYNSRNDVAIVVVGDKSKTKYNIFFNASWKSLFYISQLWKLPFNCFRLSCHYFSFTWNRNVWP